ncbi:hypothetical protein ACLBWT_01715 [Paenibacillus sp. D51F]
MTAIINQSEIKLQSLVDSFFHRIGYKAYTHIKINIEDIRTTKKRLQIWGNKPGIYFFVQDSIIKYVGRATPRIGLAQRVYEHSNAFGGLDGWDNVIGDPTVTIGIFTFDDTEDWHWLASLEVLLMDRLKPQFNKRL